MPDDILDAEQIERRDLREEVGRQRLEAEHAGAAQLLLFGFDMQGGHWHDPHPWPLYQGDDGHFPRWIARFKVLAAELAARSVEVLNCTPNSALDAFPMALLEDALAA